MDIQYLLFLQKLRELSGGIFDSFMLDITKFGESVITFLLLAFVYWCIDKRSGQIMALNVSLACTWNQVIKNICKIDRPWVRDDRVAPVEGALAGAGGYSFPSGHTQRATAVWGALGISLWKKKQRAVSLICFILLAMVAFSRNYLGVHTPQDVFAALISGMILILIVEKILNWVERGKNRDVLAAGIGCLICFLPMLRLGCLSNAGAGMGFLIGWVLERRFVKFETAGSGKERAFRFGVGAFGVILILTVVSSGLAACMASKYAGFFTGFFLAVFIMAVYPFFFSEKRRFKVGIILGVAAVVLATLGVLFIGALHHRGEQQSQADQLVQTGVPVIVAHRGYSGVYPENTLAAFEGAVDIGADMVELDVQLSADGVVVVLHDADLVRTAGAAGAPADYSYEELRKLDVGSWFDAQFSGEKIPSLGEVFQLLRGSKLGVYLELKDIGDVEGFEEAVLTVAQEYGMEDRCIFASFQYDYLKYFQDQGYRTLLNISEYDVSLPDQYEADYYGLHSAGVTKQVIDAIHAKGKQAYVWTVDTPDVMRTVLDAGADGVVTNEPGRMKVLVHDEYGFLAEHFAGSFAMPGLYGADLPAELDNVVVQGMASVGDQIVVTAYSKTPDTNSTLYVLDTTGHLQQVIDLGFCAHVGGTAYDQAHDLLWVTGPDGNVNALRWSQVRAGGGEVLYRFQAGLLNHGASPVASFLDVYEGRLYVGSYCDGRSGLLNCYDITDPARPVILTQQEIPERIQGVTFRIDQTGNVQMILSQGYQTEDSGLLVFDYDAGIRKFEEPTERYNMPEGLEQIEWTGEGLYLLFESAARPYRETARIVNDQIYLVN